MKLTVGILTVFLVFAPSMFGQTATGEISGRITDPTGGAVPDAVIVVTNVDTGIQRTTRSTVEGYYTVPLLQPGNYRITVDRQGFTPVGIASVALAVNRVLTQDFQLALGTVSTRVEVTAPPELIQSASSELGTVISETPIRELPLSGRNFTQLLTLTPGATPVSTAQSRNVSGQVLGMIGIPGSEVSQPAIQGQRNRSNLYLADGVINTDLSASVYAIPLILDTIEEFKVQSYNDKAEFGGVLGGVVNVITKSGTNRLHGSLWEFVRNDFFNARDPFNDEFRTSPSPFRQNQFGGTIGGPIYIPKIYNGRDKTFFLFAYEGWRYRQASQTRYRVPTDQEISGDFSNSIIGHSIYNPFTTRPDPNNPGQFIRDQFPNNVIPPDLISPITQGFIKTYFDRPNLVGDPFFNEINTNRIMNDSGQYNVKIDHRLTRSDSLWFRFTRLDFNAATPSQFSISRTSFDTSTVPATNIGAGWMHIFSPSVILEARFGYSVRPFTLITTTTIGTGPLLQLGFTEPSSIGLTSPWSSVGPQSSNLNTNPITHYSANINWLRGSHNVKYGFQFLSSRQTQSFGSQGSYSFDASATADPQHLGNTGASLASALLGLPVQVSSAVPTTNADRMYTWSPYVQDEWKVKRNLTVTLGLRFDHRDQFAALHGLNSTFDPTSGDYWIGASILPPPCNTANRAPCIPGTGTLQGVPNGDHITLSPYGKSLGPAPQWTEFGPRVGFAWRAASKTVLRGGYGLVYDPLSGMMQQWAGTLNIWPGAGGLNGSGGQSFNGLGAAPTNIQQLLNPAGSVTAPLPPASPWNSFAFYWDPRNKDPRSHQFHFELQRQLTSNLVASLGYVGSVSKDLALGGIFNTAVTPGPGSPQQVQARRPYPYLLVSPRMFTGVGESNYNALNFKLERRFDRGLQFLLSYTWSKSIDNGVSGYFPAENGPGGSAGLQDFHHPSSSRSVSSYDIPHLLSFASVWELPFGRTTRWLKSGPVSWLLGNWEISNVVQLRSGQPYNLAVAGDVANVGNSDPTFFYARPNLIGDPRPAHPTTQRWYNPQAFAIPSFSYGNFGRNVLRSANVYDADVSLSKNVLFGERTTLQVRAEGFNIFNLMCYSTPGTQIGVGSAGRITAIIGTPRQLQLGLKLKF